MTHASCKEIGGALDEGRDADTAVNALLAQAHLLIAQCGIVHALDQGIDAPLM
jgi:hypothetical protein